LLHAFIYSYCLPQKALVFDAKVCTFRSKASDFTSKTLASAEKAGDSVLKTDVFC
jgi:hypothetical protein